MDSLNDLWREVLKLIAEQTSSTAVDAWFSSAVPLCFDGERMVVFIPQDFKIGVIEKNYLGAVDAAFRQLMGPDILIKFEMTADEAVKEAYLDPKTPRDIEGQDFTFANYVVGASNRFAHAAALAVANAPARAYNPLFIYGSSGLGKTHLLHAIANQIRKDFPTHHILYVTGENFTNEIISAIRNNNTPSFRDKYRQVDLLLVDDVQFISRSEATQEEFFHTFNALYEANKQIVLTSDRPPKEMILLEDRLRTRFEWGLLADVKPPEFETRMAIISKKAESMGLLLDREESEYIANNITNNVRQMEGVIKKILAFHDLMGETVNLETIQRAIRDILKEHPGLKPTPALIIGEVASYTGVPERDIRGQRRDKDIAQARHIAVYLIRQLTELSLIEIGREFQGRDHTTVRKSVENVENRMKADESFGKVIEEITENITNK